MYEQRAYVVPMTPTTSANTPTRGIRVPDHEWEIFQEVTSANGETASAVARRLFRQYVRENDPEAYERLREAAARKRGKRA